MAKNAAKISMPIWEKVAAVIVVLMIVLFCSVAYRVHTIPDVCGNEIIAESASPGKVRKSVLFKHHCGAAAGASTQVSILDAGAVLDDKGGGNAVSVDIDRLAAQPVKDPGSEIQLSWLSDTHLEIQHHKSAHNFRAEAIFNGVKVDYVAFQ